MTNTQELKTASVELTEKFDTVTELAKEAFTLQDRDSREAKFNEVKEIFKEFNLSNGTQHYADSVINASIEEAGGPLSKLKERSFNRVLDEISDHSNVAPREKIGQFHNDPTWS